MIAPEPLRQPRVVIVEPDSDCRQVLLGTLSRRGLATYAAKGAGDGLKLICQHDPDVIVLDGDASGADDVELQEQLDSQLQRGHARLIVLGTLRSRRIVPQQRVAKPYHFAPLIHTIEAMAAAKAA